MKKKMLLLIAASSACLVAAPAYAQNESVRVHIATTNPDVVLQLIDSEGTHEVCQAPCDRMLPTETGYRIVGPGIQASKKFVLTKDDASVVVLDVNTASRGLRIFGVVSLALGATSVIAGLNVMVFGWLLNLCSECIDGLANTTAVNIGWTMVATGIVAAIAGAVIVRKTRTTVDIQGSASTWSNGAPAAWLPDDKRLVQPTTLGAPIVSFTF